LVCGYHNRVVLILKTTGGLEMNEFSTANYQTDGEWVIGGKLTILPDAAVTGLPIPVLENQASSVAEDVADLVTDFNALLAKLKAAGLMEPDSE
jgi:hypothetical protein